MVVPLLEKDAHSRCSVMFICSFLALRFQILEARGREGIFACGCHTVLGLYDRAEVPWKLVQMGCVGGKSSCST